MMKNKGRHRRRKTNARHLHRSEHSREEILSIILRKIIKPNSIALRKQTKTEKMREIVNMTIPKSKTSIPLNMKHPTLETPVLTGILSEQI